MAKKGNPADKYRVLHGTDVSNFFKADLFGFNRHEQEYFLDVTMYDRSCICAACTGRALEFGETTKVTNKAEERRQLRLMKQEETRRALAAKMEYERKALRACSKISAFFRMIGPKDRWQQVRLLKRQFKRKRAYVVIVDQYAKGPVLESIRAPGVLVARGLQQVGFETEVWSGKAVNEATRPTRQNLENLFKMVAAAPPEDLVVVYIAGRGGKGVIPGVMPVKKQNESKANLTPRARLREALRIHNKVTTGDASALRYLCPSNASKVSTDTVFRIDDLMDVVTSSPQHQIGYYSCATAQRVLLVDLYEAETLPTGRSPALPDCAVSGSYAMLGSTVTCQIAWEIPHQAGMLTQALLRALHGFATTLEDGLTVTSLVKRIYRDLKKAKLPAPEVKDLWCRAADPEAGVARPKHPILAIKANDAERRSPNGEEGHAGRTAHPWERVYTSPEGESKGLGGTSYVHLMSPRDPLVTEIVSGTSRPAKLPSPASRPGMHRTPLSKRIFLCVTVTTPTAHRERPLPQAWVDDIVDYIQSVTQNQESKIGLGTAVDTKHVRIALSVPFAEVVEKQAGGEVMEKLGTGFKYDTAAFEKCGNGDATLVLTGVADDADLSAVAGHEAVKDVGDVVKLYLFTNVRVALALTSMLKLNRGNLVTQAQAAADEHARQGARQSRMLSVFDRFQRLKTTTVCPTVVGLEIGTHNILDVCNVTFKGFTYLVVLIITGDTQKAKATQLMAAEAVAKNYDPDRMPFYYLDSHTFRQEAKHYAKDDPLFCWLQGIHAASYPLPSSCFPQVFLCDRQKQRHYTYSVEKARNATASTLTHFIEEMHKGNLEDLIPPVKGSKVSGWGSSSSKYVLLPPFEKDIARGAVAKVKVPGSDEPQF
eukprot:TRINITY_DN29829_c0_g1_i1.p1 TRINITY_DN29829_c0_g1~~TRINITY_DN29829_c0_g1_i1.p1  ORF type:complete len:880 (+),score=304.54 TRINITY_DN29829_c0_g1_i1:130-2769(+)